VLAEALLPAAATGTEAAREAAATLLTTPGWRPAPERLLFTGRDMRDEVFEPGGWVGQVVAEVFTADEGASGVTLPAGRAQTQPACRRSWPHSRQIRGGCLVGPGREHDPHQPVSSRR
jgi:hypothetical protein